MIYSFRILFDKAILMIHFLRAVGDCLGIEVNGSTQCSMPILISALCISTTIAIMYCREEGNCAGWGGEVLWIGYSNLLVSVCFQLFSRLIVYVSRIVGADNFKKFITIFFNSCKHYYVTTKQILFRRPR